MAYGDFIDLTGRTASDKELRDKIFNIANILNHDGHQRSLASMVYRFFNKKHLIEQLKMRICLMKN